jgi:hypothetical protein
VAVDHGTICVPGPQAPEQPGGKGDRQQDSDAVDLRDSADRDVEPLGLLVTCVGSGAGDERAADESEGCHHRQRLDVRGRALAHRRRAHSVVGLAGADHEDHGEGDEDHREQEVLLVGERVEVGEHDDAADDALHRDTESDQDGEPLEVASWRAPTERAERGGDDRDHHDSGEQSVDLLDRSVRGGDVDELRVVAVRPVRAPEAGAAQPDGRAGDDDQAHGSQRGDADLAVGRRRHRHPA